MAEKPATEKKKDTVVVSVINLKGGVGKTTVTALMARYAVQHFCRVLVVDLDPQANLSQALMLGSEYKQFMKEKSPSIVELFNGYLPPKAGQGTPVPITDVVRKTRTQFYGRDSHIYLIPSRFDFAKNLIAPLRADERVLARFIAGEVAGKVDLVLIDCAPTESILTQAAYHASRHILIPVRTEFLATIGFPLLCESLEGFQAQNPAHQIDVCGVLINNAERPSEKRGPHHRDAHKDITEQAKKYGWPVMKHEMYQSRGYPKMVKELHPTSIGNARREFEEIANEFLVDITGVSKREEVMQDIEKRMSE